MKYISGNCTLTRFPVFSFVANRHDGRDFGEGGGVMNGIKKTGLRPLLILMGISMSACAGLIPHTTSWKEEVKLHDGRVIVAERHYKLGGYAYLDSSERTPLNETVTFNLPDSNQKIIWNNDFRDSVPEPNSLNHFRFDIVNGVPYLATYPAGCIAYNKWGRPNPPQILFKYEDEQWKRITLAELPPELIGTTANVIVGRPASSQQKFFYAVESVNEENRNISTPEYTTILREAVKGGDGSSVNCEKLIPYGKGGWLGFDWFTDQPSLEACLKFCDQKQVKPESCPCNSIFKGAK